MSAEKFFEYFKTLEAKATKGPWYSENDGDVWTKAEKEYCPGIDQELFKTFGTTTCGPDPGDAKFIAASRQGWPKTVEALKIAIDSLEKFKGIAMPSLTTGSYCTADITFPANQVLDEINQILKLPEEK